MNNLTFVELFVGRVGLSLGMERFGLWQSLPMRFWWLRHA